MHLTRLRLRNIACFEDIELRFTQDGKDRPSQWVVLLGENGTGKSTILQMLGLGLLGPLLFSDVAGGIDWTQYVRSNKGAKSGKIQFRLTPDSSDNLLHDMGSAFLNHTVEIGDAVDSGAQLALVRYDGPSIFPGLLYDRALSGGWFACGYSP